MLSAPSRTSVFLLFLSSLLIGLAQVALLPPFEGFDETGHYAYVQQIAETGHWPRRGDRMSAEIDDYMMVAPTTDSMKPRWTYYSFVAEGGDRAAARNMIQHQPAPQDFVPGSVGNWQAQHPPLYYAAMAPIYRLLKSSSLSSRLLVMRTCSYILAWGALCLIAIYALGNRADDVRATTVLPLALAAWPFVFPAWFPEMGRLGNDSLVTVFSACTLLLLFRIVTGAKALRDHALLGFILTLGLLTKATFIPVAAAAVVTVTGRALSPRIDPQVRRDRLKGVALCVAVVLAGSSWWYLSKFIETGSVIGSNDAVFLGTSRGLIAGIAEHLSLRKLAHAPWLLVTTFLWSGTWSFTLPPKIAMFPLIALAALIALGCIFAMKSLRSLQVIDAFAVLTAVLFLAGLSCYSVIQFSLLGLPQPAWYFHSVAPIIAILLGYGLAGIMRVRWLFTATAILIVYALVFLPSAMFLSVSYQAGCGPKLPKIYHVSLSDMVACIADYPRMYEQLAIISWPALAGALLVCGWLVAVVAVFKMFRDIRLGHV